VTEKSVKRNLERDFEWSLAFAPDEVVPRLENLFCQHGYAYTQEEQASEMRFHATLGQGTLDIVMHPLEPKRSPFSASIIQQRTLVRMTYTGVSKEDQATFKQRLTMAFLRVGG
jgi:hypothetical protein